MEILIVCVGKLKERWWRDACAEYEKRLGRYAKMRIVQVSDEPTPDSPSDAQALLVREREGREILKKIPQDAFAAALPIPGKRMNSETFAAWIGEHRVRGTRCLCLIIGGSLGLSKEVLQRADLEISFSDFTFPHQLMRVILLEQIYRGMRILAGEPYHK